MTGIRNIDHIGNRDRYEPDLFYKTIVVGAMGAVAAHFDSRWHGVALIGMMGITSAAAVDMLFQTCLHGRAMCALMRVPSNDCNYRHFNAQTDLTFYVSCEAGICAVATAVFASY